MRIHLLDPRLVEQTLGLSRHRIWRFPRHVSVAHQGVGAAFRDDSEYSFEIKSGQDRVSLTFSDDQPDRVTVTFLRPDSKHPNLFLPFSVLVFGSITRVAYDEEHQKILLESDDQVHFSMMSIDARGNVELVAGGEKARGERELSSGAKEWTHRVKNAE